MPALPAAKVDTDRPMLLPAGQDHVRKAMAAHGKTVTALAAELGISRKHLSNILNGRAPLLEPQLRRLSQALAIEPSFLTCLLDDGLRPGPARSSYGCMKGTIKILADSTEPMEDWEMLED